MAGLNRLAKKFGKAIKILYQFFLLAIAPKFCFVCFREGDFVCLDCLKTLDFQKKYFCFVCRKRLPENVLCQTHHRQPIQYFISFGDYENPILRRLIILAKYQYCHEIFRFFGQIIKRELGDLNENVFLVPVPMTRRKFLARGFNQAEILAKEIDQLKVKNVLYKIKETKEQASLSFAERKTNLQNAFVAKGKVTANLILIDDVITSGSTLKECALALKKAGARKILALTLLH